MLVDFSKSFDFIYRRKVEQILFAYSLPKETLTTIMTLYKNTKAMVHSPNGKSNYFNIVAGVFQRDSLAPYQFMICHRLHTRNVNQSKRKWFHIKKKKARSRRYSAESMRNADYTNDLTLLANTPVQAESLLHSLEHAAGRVGLCVNANKTELMYFREPSLSGKPLK